ncbi:hypothetical protein [Novosphingobium sp. Fuku2-ISO-50]|uniref:hypothetical protein n=1 Tax=Novosphingobium sp. Fuku2-ISO-50 TaxID=1739114 RepID=UPI00076C43B5|nr:hypothetical protein [Novosphingobium sp. Fuku2-ISO-50]KUR79140.1 hypothetical protein AQZ50_04550 [Novosphingobium sp. Fuku2-ISO-50]
MQRARVTYLQTQPWETGAGSGGQIILKGDSKRRANFWNMLAAKPRAKPKPRICFIELHLVRDLALALCPELAPGSNAEWEPIPHLILLDRDR